MILLQEARSFSAGDSGRAVDELHKFPPVCLAVRAGCENMLQWMMAGFDYKTPAELFPSRSRKGNRPAGYRRFESAAEAIRFAVEEMPSDYLSGAILECDEARFDSNGILELYNRSDYPLARKPK